MKKRYRDVEVEEKVVAENPSSYVCWRLTPYCPSPTPAMRKNLRQRLGYKTNNP